VAGFTNGSCTYDSALTPTRPPKLRVESTMLDVATANKLADAVA